MCTRSQDFGRNYEGDAKVKIPWVRPDLSGTRVLTMEWIDGLRCTDPAGIQSSGIDVDEFIRCGVVSGLRQLLEVGAWSGMRMLGARFGMHMLGACCACACCACAGFVLACSWAWIVGCHDTGCCLSLTGIMHQLPNVNSWACSSALQCMPGSNLKECKTRFGSARSSIDSPL